MPKKPEDAVTFDDLWCSVSCPHLEVPEDENLDYRCDIFGPLEYHDFAIADCLPGAEDAADDNND